MTPKWRAKVKRDDKSQNVSTMLVLSHSFYGFSIAQNPLEPIKLEILTQSWESKWKTFLRNPKVCLQSKFEKVLKKCYPTIMPNYNISKYQSTFK